MDFHDLPGLTHRLLNMTKNQRYPYAMDKPGLMELYGLSAREAEILHLIVLQYSNLDIADRTNISRNTVKFHLKNLLAKMEVSTRQEAARKALMG